MKYINRLYLASISTLALLAILVSPAYADPPASFTLDITSTAHTCSLSWSASAGATDYTIKQDGVSVATTAATNYVVTGLVDATTYNYIVTANGTGTTDSNAVDCTPIAHSSISVIQLIGFGISGLIGAWFITQFRWRSHE